MKKVAKFIAVILAFAVLLGLMYLFLMGWANTYKPIINRPTNPLQRHKVQLLFQIDSCKVYRFVDPDYSKTIKYLQICPCGQDKVIE